MTYHPWGVVGNFCILLWGFIGLAFGCLGMRFCIPCIMFSTYNPSKISEIYNNLWQTLLFIGDNYLINLTEYMKEIKCDRLDESIN